MSATTTTHRGTSNSNERGSSYARRARREWMMATFADEDGQVRCYVDTCQMVLTNEGPSDAADYMTVDRITPGVEGGRYVRSNIRPACGRCNSETGQALGQARKVTQMTTVAI